MCTLIIFSSNIHRLYSEGIFSSCCIREPGISPSFITHHQSTRIIENSTRCVLLEVDQRGVERGKAFPNVKPPKIDSNSNNARARRHDEFILPLQFGGRYYICLALVKWLWGGLGRDNSFFLSSFRSLNLCMLLSERYVTEKVDNFLQLDMLKSFFDLFNELYLWYDL